jgi:rod shape-determining protein MreC
MKFIYTKTFAWFVGCLVVVLILFFLQVKGWLEPLQYVFVQAPRPVASVVDHTVGPIKSFFTSLYTLRGISKQNGELQGKVTELQQKLQDLNQYKVENEALKKELGFVNQSPLTLEPCTVLSLDPQGVTDTMVLNCGEDKGLAEGQAVVSQGYLVGKIIIAGKFTSTALLITNAQSSVDASITRTQTDGVIKGSYGSGMVLDFVPQNASFDRGDLIVTAGINTLIPKGLLIGEVGQLISKPNDLFKRATVVNPIRFHDLQFVFVVKR